MDDGIADDLEEFVLSCLDRRMPAIGYALSRGIDERFRGMAMLEGTAPAFDLEAYAHEGLCELAERSEFHSRRSEFWLGAEAGTVSRPQETLFEVTWEDHRLLVLIVHWHDPTSPTPYHFFILSERGELVHEFHVAVCAWNTREPEEYILVFDVDGWSKDDTLLSAIQGATLDTLVLRGELKEEILQDLRSFFFDLPAQPEREGYIEQWNASLKPATQLSESGCAVIAELTEEFSFAYLKELFLSSMMRWIALPERSHMDEVMREQVASLREQMRDVEELLTDQSYPPGIPGWHHGRRMPHRGPHPMHPQDVPL